MRNTDILIPFNKPSELVSHSSGISSGIGGDRNTLACLYFFEPISHLWRRKAEDAATVPMQNSVEERYFARGLHVNEYLGNIHIKLDNNPSKNRRGGTLLADLSAD